MHASLHSEERCSDEQELLEVAKALLRSRRAAQRETTRGEAQKEVTSC